MIYKIHWILGLNKKLADFFQATNLSVYFLPILANADRSMCVPFVTFPDPPRHRPGGATLESLERAGPEILQVGKFNTYKKSSRLISK